MYIVIILVTLVMPIPALAISTQQDDGAIVTPVADVTVTGTATLISAANNNRATLSCTNTSASVNVRWGNASVTATTGQRLPFGTAIEIRSRGAVYMISEGANVTVSCTEEVR